ncbi:MAG: phosphatidate cytidylyltransferase [Treponema sp.]|jgi:phosphatidate cytidylyltransferase|nr:phosphatidate cytidylyltransferase [Treponema sp.]
MKKMLQRLLIFFIGLPLVVFVVCFLPYFHHLALNLTVIVFSALGAAELAAILEKKGLRVPKTEAMILGALLPAAETLALSLNWDDWVTTAFFAAGVFWILVSVVFFRLKDMDRCVNRIAAGFTVLIYPGFLLEWIIKMGGWERAEIIIIVFLLSVMGNDSTAWAAGMLLGRGNRGIIPASPNKSVAGFIGGTIASIAVGAGAALLFPGVFVPRFDSVFFISSAPCAGIILGLLSGIAAALGDLSESAIKRSSGSKDSGHIMPGRGGVLDSIDSITLAAPVFYLVFSLLFKQPQSRMLL